MSLAKPLATESKKRFHLSDLLAGLSVALVAIPQSLAYAELAGIPAYIGLYALAFSAIAAAFFASSPYLQTGPTAMTALLTLGVLSSLAKPFSADYIALAALLALLVGVIRVALGLLRLGSVAYLLSQPVLMGFTTAAAILIFGSQLPTALGVSAQGSGIFQRIFYAFTHLNEWHLAAVGLSVATIVLMRLGKRIHALFPTVLVAVIIGLAYSLIFAYNGSVVGEIPRSLPTFSFAISLSTLPGLVVGALVIAVVGFAEPASIARTYATQDRSKWNANQEFISQGVANIAAGLFAAFPVGGSFSRSSVNRIAGAKTRWSGLVTGVVVLAFLPFTFLLSSLPKAILAAIVIAAVINLIRVKELWQLRTYSKAQAHIAWITFALTLLLSPRIDFAVLIGIGLAVAHHLRREQKVFIDIWEYANTLNIKPKGVLWFGSSASVEETLNDALARHPEVTGIEFHLGGLGRIDLSAALMLERLMKDAEKAGLEVNVNNVPPMAQRWLDRVWKDAPERDD